MGLHTRSHVLPPCSQHVASMTTPGCVPALQPVVGQFVSQFWCVGACSPFGKQQQSGLVGGGLQFAPQFAAASAAAPTMNAAARSPAAANRSRESTILEERAIAASPCVGLPCPFTSPVAPQKPPATLWQTDLLHP